MLAAETLLGADTFRVEVSGWDENQTYFVEKSDLVWDDFTGKHISLQRILPDGAFVFLRLLQPTALCPPPPVAYRVEFVGCDPQGQHLYRLNAIHPRYSRESNPVN